MGTVSVTNITDGTTADAADVNSQINAILAEFNGGIDNTNIDSAAAIAGSKLADNSINLTDKASSFDGWIEVSDSWSYASATTVTVPTDAATKYSVGDKIKFDNSSTKYFYVVAVAATTLTLSGGTDYTVANSAISNIYYSKTTSPLSFPQYFTWAPTLTNLSGGAVTYAKFTIHGRTVFFRFKYTLGGAGVAGAVDITFPVTSAIGATSEDVPGVVLLTDTGTTSAQGKMTYIDTSKFRVQAVNSAGTYVTAANVSSTVPFTWANTDVIFCAGQYDI